MPKTLDSGRRIELHSMDKHCGGISIGLYAREAPDGPRFLVHTYSGMDGAAERIAFIRRALQVMAGLEPVDDAPDHLRFPCGKPHLRALKRSFLDLCKLETGADLAPRPLTVHDKKAEGRITARGLGSGAYEIVSEDGSDQGARRAVAVARGFAKLCDMGLTGDPATRVAFACGTDHDPMIGMLMFRAQNARATMREEEEAAARGALAAPSQQK